MIHVITPFSREHLRKIFTEHLKQFPVESILCEEEVYTKDPAYEKANNFIKKGNIKDEDYYCFLCDDDNYEVGFFDNLPDADVIFVSMKRGDNVVGQGVSRHPTNTLIAAPENIKLMNVGFEQFIVKGRVLKQMKFTMGTPYADGMMAMWLKENFKCVYEPNRFVLFNRLEKGRYSNLSEIVL